MDKVNGAFYSGMEKFIELVVEKEFLKERYEVRLSTKVELESFRVSCQFEMEEKIVWCIVRSWFSISTRVVWNLRYRNFLFFCIVFSPCLVVRSGLDSLSRLVKYSQYFYFFILLSSIPYSRSPRFLFPLTLHRGRNLVEKGLDFLSNFSFFFLSSPISLLFPCEPGFYLACFGMIRNPSQVFWFCRFALWMPNWWAMTRRKNDENHWSFIYTVRVIRKISRFRPSFIL